MFECLFRDRLDEAASLFLLFLVSVDQLLSLYGTVCHHHPEFSIDSWTTAVGRQLFLVDKNRMKHMSHIFDTSLISQVTRQLLEGAT
jgi:hypothetical protein